MAKTPKFEEVQTGEGQQATQPPRRDAQNRLIDADGMPVSGPARAAAVAKNTAITEQSAAAPSAYVAKKDDA